MTPTVFVIDDDEAVRDSLLQLFESEDFTVETFPSGRAFLETFDLSRPGCIIADVRMPGISGVELIQQLRDRRCETPVVIITAHGDVPLAVTALKAGASDFFEKPLDNSALLESVKTAIDHGRRRGEDAQAVADLRRKHATLTAREKEVMDLAVEGHPNKVIAARLGTSPRTIEVHRSHILAKLEARNLSDLIRMALRIRGEYRPGG
jgi:two-component system response regulator FixJ